MPSSPNVKFQIENNNLEVTSPQVGVSCLLARTLRGPFNDPSTIITTISQFKNLFGGEIVPDGTPSNIEKALLGGSKLRIIRVPGSGYYKGILGETSEDEVSSTPVPDGVIKITIEQDDVEKTVTLGFYTKNYDEDVDGASTFDADFVSSGNTWFCNIHGTGKTTLVESLPVITTMSADTVNKATIDYLQFYNWLNNSAYLEPVILTNTLGITSVNGLINWLSSFDGSDVTVSIDILNSTHTASTNVWTLTSTPGSSGSAPTKQQWIESLDYLRDYNEPYQVACSHLDQHLSADADILAVHKAAKELVDELDEFSYYIEVPRYTTHHTQGTTVRDKDSIITWVTTCLGVVGNSKNVSYFAGGIKYYDENGILVDSNVLGTIIGLGDDSASKYGPWKSFAGMNRGVIYDGNGPSCPNYGAPSRYEALNELAANYVNMVVVKDTSNAGKQTMLWHCFTSQVKQDSFKFLSVVRLVYFLKKFLRPILESKIEEPNWIPTWKDIYLTVKPTLDDLVEQEAMTEYTWMGDQNATGYNDLQVNNEADVRMGKYRARLTFKEIVPMQDVNIDLVIDKTAKTVSVELSD